MQKKEKKRVPKRVYTVGWLAIAASAAVLETLALTNKVEGDTFSEHVWRVHGIHRSIWWGSLVATILGMVWLVRHLFWKKKI